MDSTASRLYLRRPILTSGPCIVRSLSVACWTIGLEWTLSQPLPLLRHAEYDPLFFCVMDFDVEL